MTSAASQTEKRRVKYLPPKIKKKKNKVPKKKLDPEKYAKKIANLRPWKKGQSGNPRGRPLEYRVSKHTEAELKEIATRYGITPLEFMVACIRDETQSMAFRLDAAATAAPYMHRRMPIGIDNGSGGPIGFYTAEQLAKLDDAQLEQLKKAVELLAMVANPQPLPIDVTPTRKIEHDA